MPVDAGAAEAALDLLIQRIAEATEQAVADGAALVEAAAKRNAPVRTGTLRRSIAVEGPIPVGLAVYSARVGPTVIYGRIRELGGHIYPVNVRFLRWYGADGRPVFARHVYQHGRPYLKPAVSASRRRFRAIAVRRWAEAIDSV